MSDQSEDYEMIGYFKSGEGKDRSISDSSIGSYFEPEKTQVQISTHQLLDQVYEKYMINLPDDLLESFKLAESTKVEIISELFAQRILQIEMEIAENQSDTQFLQYQDEYKRQVLGQRKAVEKFLNACLFERVSSEKKFNYLSHLVPQLNKAIERAFQLEF